MPEGTDFTTDVRVDGLSLLPVGRVGSAGKVFYCNYDEGSDGDDGTALRPLKTLKAAYDLCVDGRGDTVVIQAQPNATDGTGAGSQHLAASLTWSKSNTHLVGDSAPTMIGQRARVTGESTGATFTPLITISGNACVFLNVAFYHDYSNAAAICVALTGDRCYFKNVHFAGGIGALALAGANARSITLTGAHENTFERCIFGVDTGDHTAANADMEFATNCARNVFLDCVWETKIDAAATGAAHVFIKFSASSVDRWTLFRNCAFINSTTYSGGAGMTNAMTTSATQGGALIMQQCMVTGCTDVGSVDCGILSDKAAPANDCLLAVAQTR